MATRTGFLAELRQRRVFRTVAAYAVAAWVVVQIAEATFEPLRIPDWVGSLVVLGALLGFPVTLVLAWAFEVTPGGVRLDGPSRRSRLIYAAAVIWGVLVIGYLGVERYLDLDSEASVPPVALDTTLGVLPLANLGAPALDYFSDGITDELIGTLSHLEGVRVIGRASAFQFKGRQIGIKEIARELGVTHVLEGSVRRDSDRFRISLQLTAASDGFQLWSQFFDGRMEDVLNVQMQIAEAVAEGLARQLGVRDPAERGRPVDIDTYDLYLLAQQYFNRRGADDLERAATLFRRAIERNPDFAEAHAGLAGAVLLMGRLGLMPLEDALPIAESSSRNAIDRSRAPVEGYASLGLLELTRGNLTAARKALARALALNGNYANAWLWLGMTHEAQGRVVAAARAYRLAVDLEPLHPEINRRLAQLDFAAGRQAEAASRIDRMLAFHEQVALLYQTRALGALSYGQAADALDWLARGDEAAGSGPMSRYLAVRASLMAGAVGDARAALVAVPGAAQDPLLDFLAQAIFYLASDDAAGLANFARQVAGGAADESLVRSATAWHGIAECRIGSASEGARRLSVALDGAGSGTFGPSDRALYAGTLVACLMKSQHDSEAMRLGDRLIESLHASRELGWRAPDSLYAIAAAYAASLRFDDARTWLQHAFEAGWAPEVPLSRDPRWRAWFEQPDACAELPFSMDVTCERSDG